jgi:glycerol uptake facilitator-like aquaporin
VSVRNQPLRIVVVVGLWVMFALWTIARFTGTVVEQLPNSGCTRFTACASATSVAVARQFSWSWWHFILSLVGAGLLVAASIMILRSPRSIDDF